MKARGSFNAAHLLPVLSLLVLAAVFRAEHAEADPDTRAMLHPELGVSTVVTGLVMPTTMAFLGPGDILVLEKNTGRVQRVADGAITATVLDLAVNFGSERGLLGIALHPSFPSDPGVYLFWTESSTGSDTNVLSETPLLGNRVDRFEWNGSALVFDHNLTRIRAIQTDAGQPERGNNNGGVLVFGPDGNLYVFIGDVGRRGHLQNLPCGPTASCPGPPVADDSFGGPEPDDAHLTGVILRLNPDGSAPIDNPFFAAGAGIGGEVGANIQSIYSYGHRNSFGMAFDPLSGGLWMQENGDDSFSELNRVEAGFNGGWIQTMGPVSRIDDYKAIETTFGAASLQQLRWPPTNIADTPAEALSRLYMLPGATYTDPVLSWLWDIAPAGLGFVRGTGLGEEFEGDLFMGAATTNLEGGYLFRIALDASRESVAVEDPALVDGVADNIAKHDITESESLLIGRNFGVVTDIETGPNGNLFAVSLSDGAIYEIFRRELPELPQLTVTKVCLNDPGNATFEIVVEGEATLFDCGQSLAYENLEPGPVSISERISGPDADAFVTVIVCSGREPVVATRATATIADDDVACTVINIFDPNDQDSASLICTCLLNIEIDVTNDNTNMISIEEGNENTNSNVNDSLNDNNNGNLNGNENTNTQDQDNGFDQDNQNQQTNNVTASPEVNIDR